MDRWLITETREGKWIADLLKDYDGHVMGDAYAGHNQLLNRDDILALFCWAHVRRKFFESADKRRRKVMLQLIGRLYDIEREIAELPPDQRVVQRQQPAQPILAHIHETLSAWQADPAILPKSGIGRATVKGAKSYAILLTVIQSALMHDLNPETYLNDVVEAMHHKRLPMAQLTPAAYAARDKAGCKLRS